jgi:predicted Holliday junction resolvase-like endonuclease
MDWINKNLKWIILIVLFLLMIKTFQACSREVSLRNQEKKSNIQIDSLKKEILARDFLVLDLKNELKIAGVKYDEAQKRADAVQKTASSIKANTTIEVKGVEREYNTKNK